MAGSGNVAGDIIVDDGGIGDTTGMAVLAMFLLVLFPAGLQTFRQCKDLALMLVMILQFHFNLQEAEHTAIPCNVMASDVGRAFGVPEGDLYIFLCDVRYNTGDIDIQQHIQPLQPPTTAKI